MKKINIAILGTIGVGKTTLLNKLREKLSEYSSNIIIKAEPSVTVPFVNDVLKKFYNDNASWSFCLQLLISAVQESYFQDLRESEYDYSLFDMPYSSDIYSYSHMKHDRMTPEGHHSLVSIGSRFPFDYAILINEDKETTISRVRKRNKRVEEGDMDPDKKDVAIDDFSYLDSHIADFKEYQEVWLSRFKADNPNIKIIKLNHIPDIGTEEYDTLIDELAETIKERGTEYEEVQNEQSDEKC